MSVVQGLEYMNWRHAMHQAVAAHDVKMLRDAGCECESVILTYVGVLRCGNCGVENPAAYPKATYK